MFLGQACHCWQQWLLLYSKIQEDMNLKHCILSEIPTFRLIVDSPPLPHTRTHLCIWSWFSDLPSRFSSITVKPQTMDAGKWNGHLGWRGPGRGAIRGMHKAKGTERNHCSWRHFRGFWGTAAKDQDVRLLWGYADVEEYRSITFTKLTCVGTEYYNVPPGQLYIATPPQLTKLPFEIHTKCTLVLQ